MNKPLRLLLIAATTLLFSLAAWARASIPVVEYTDLPIVTHSGKQLLPEDVKKVIVAAGQQHQWQFVPGPEKNTLIGTLNVRHKHTISVNIHYSTDRYSITYRDSSNMNFKIDSSGQKLIHPKYNIWVQNLIANIRTEAGKL